MNKIFGVIAIAVLLIGGYVLFSGTSINAPTDTQGGYGGLSVSQAIELARTRGVPFRVVELDGVPRPTTMDYRVGRVNAEVENDTVIGYTIE